MMDKHNHGEAFMLMQYQCERCEGIAKVWNSRDGVTPFTIECLYGCAPPAHMTHIAWKQDEYLPDHAPQDGDYIFVSMTPDLARALANRYVAHLDNDERFRKEYRDEKRQHFRDKLIDEWTKHQEPALVRIP